MAFPVPFVTLEKYASYTTEDLLPMLQERLYNSENIKRIFFLGVDAEADEVILVFVFEQAGEENDFRISRTDFYSYEIDIALQ